MWGGLTDIGNTTNQFMHEPPHNFPDPDLPTLQHYSRRKAFHGLFETPLRFRA